jgi:hypothetical protein
VTSVEERNVGADEAAAAIDDQGEFIAVRMVFSVVGVGQANTIVSVSPDKAAELVASNAARFVDPPEPAPVFADSETPAAADATANDAAVSEVSGNGGKGPRTRESRPRASAGARAGSGGAESNADDPPGAEPGESNLAG